MIKRIAHICIASDDLKASEAFYCGVLELKKAFSFIRDGKELGFYLDAGGGNFIEVFDRQHIEQSSSPAIIHFCLEVDDIDKAIASIRGKGVEITEKKMECDHSWQAWITDPAGIKIELHQYTEKSTQLTGEDCIVE